MSLKRIFKWFYYLLFTLFAIVLIANVWVVISTRAKVFTDCNQLPDNNVALVLGTSQKLMDGSPNPFFENRIEAAALLYNSGKADHFILSGDNRSRYYNEPLAMQKALVQKGVPDSLITLDYAGLRTLDSVVRSKEIFGQNRIIIITQSFHCYRALFISQFYEIDALALVAEAPPSWETAIKIYFREFFARPKAVLDLYVLKTAPRHLGDKEPLKR